MHEKKEMESSMVLHGLRTYHKRSIFIGFISIVLVLILLMVRLGGLRERAYLRTTAHVRPPRSSA